MSKVKITGNASGTGVLTIEAPNTNTDRTISLPDSTDTLVGQSTTNALAAADTALTTRVNAVGGRKNLIINGAMQVWQRGTSVAWAANGYQTVDRFGFHNNNTAGRFTSKQTADGPSGLANCLEIDVTTTDTSIASNEHLVIQYRLEGQDLQQIAKGTADAKQVTISFYVKGNGSATYMCEMFDRDNTRLIQQHFSVTSSWTRVELTFAADTIGTLDDDSAHSLDVQFWLHAGSDFTSGSFASNTWASQNNATRVGGISSLYSSTSNYFRITGLQLEVGNQATDFEHRSYGEELALCQRYYQIYGGKADSEIYSGWAGNTSGYYQTIRFLNEMRTVPTMTINGGWVSSNISGVSFTYGSNKGFALLVTPSAVGRWYWYANTSDDTYTADAEL